jgi:hypothetical protein
MSEVGLCPFMLVLLSHKSRDRKVENCDRHFYLFITKMRLIVLKTLHVDVYM